MPSINALCRTIAVVFAAIASPQTSAQVLAEHRGADYLEYARRYYVRDGQVTDEVACIEAVIRVWANLFPSLPISEFGPKALKQLREEMIRMTDNCSRR